jgi:TIR domain
MNTALQAEATEIQTEIDRLQRRIDKSEIGRNEKQRRLEGVNSDLAFQPKSLGLKNKRLKFATQIEGHRTFETEMSRFISELRNDLSAAHARAEFMLTNAKTNAIADAQRTATARPAQSKLVTEKLIREELTHMYDVFVSHASEDKESVVRPLVRHLQHLGLQVWYDEFELKLGDSLRRSIDSGLRQSRFGVVVLSKAFFAKQWPQYELDSLVAREIEEGRVILPIWHGVSKLDVMNFSPRLADKVAASTEAILLDDLALQIYRALL